MSSETPSDQHDSENDPTMQCQYTDTDSADSDTSEPRNGDGSGEERSYPTHPDTLTESVPWIRYVDTMPATGPFDEDYKVQTNISIVDMDEHPRILANDGYYVQRIAFDQPYGCKFFCTMDP